ncbi:MAG: leucine--tRNA ligase, partial [Planctomycetota bacterium]
TFRKQLKAVGFSYDWDREIGTFDPSFYKWTQWIFLKLFEKGLAYQDEATVNWCPALGTVLANDEVIDGKSERGGHEVVQKPMKQWMLRITEYADRLLEGLDRIDFPESLKAMQRERIGRSEGADATFKLAGTDGEFEIFTTRPDTMFGATFCVLAPEHPLVDAITTDAQRAAVKEYVDTTLRKSEIERTGTTEKTGVFTGGHAINPMTGAEVPIWVADYVLMSYGTGAIMCVPGHDQRDWEFAQEFDLPIVEVITGGDVAKEAYSGDGTMVNSGFLDGMSSSDAIPAAAKWLEDQGIGKAVVRYKMRDWIFARQRYWGEPVPIVFDEEGAPHAVPFTALPVELPECEDFKPAESGESPLARVKDWVETPVPGTDQPGRRETDTMPGSAGSSWYFLRYLDPNNEEELCAPEIAKRWMPVDLYVGGAEHAVGHLLYSRFWTKFLYDIGACPVDEPYKKLVNQGMILGSDHRKMGKRYGNTVDPLEVIESHGADTLRVYEMFMGPLEADAPWDPGGVEGVWRFLNRVWRLYFDENDALSSAIVDEEPSEAVQRVLHKTIEKVDHDTAGLRFNTAISAMMTFVNELTPLERRPRVALETFVKLLAPFAPHLAAELWAKLGHDSILMLEPFPAADEKWLVEDTVEIPIQINGKVRDRVTVSADITEDAVRELAFASERVQQFVEGKELKKFIYVPGRMVTIAVAG